MRTPAPGRASCISPWLGCGTSRRVTARLCTATVLLPMDRCGVNTKWSSAGAACTGGTRLERRLGVAEGTWAVDLHRMKHQRRLPSQRAAEGRIQARPLGSANLGPHSEALFPFPRSSWNCAHLQVQRSTPVARPGNGALLAAPKTPRQNSRISRDTAARQPGLHEAASTAHSCSRLARLWPARKTSTYGSAAAIARCSGW